MEGPSLEIFSHILIILASLCLLGLVCCFFYEAWKQNLRWLCFLFVIPGPLIIYIIYLGLRVVRGGPFFKNVPKKVYSKLMIGCLVFEFSGILISGDLIVNRHPNEPSERTWRERFFGCTGIEFQNSLADQEGKDLIEMMQQYSALDYTMTQKNQSVLVAAKAALLTYHDESFLEEKGLLNWQDQKIRYQLISPKMGHQHAGVFGTSNVILVAFRGTDDKQDWVSNLEFISKKTNWGRVHLGFEEAVKELWQQLLPIVEEFRDNDQSIWLTGHSLGGAMALVGANKFQQEGLGVKGIVTFGAPRTADKEFGDNLLQYVSNGVIRVVNYHDPVPTAGVYFSLTNYILEHFGDLWYFNSRGELSHELPSFWDQNFQVCKMERSEGQFSDHNMNRYLILVHNYVNQ